MELITFEVFALNGDLLFRGQDEFFGCIDLMEHIDHAWGWDSPRREEVTYNILNRELLDQ